MRDFLVLLVGLVDLNGGNHRGTFRSFCFQSQPAARRLFKVKTWMSQKVSKWLVNGLFHLLINGIYMGVT